MVATRTFLGIALAAGTLLVTGAVLVPASAQAASGTTTVIAPGADVAAAMQQLQAGDTLRLRPGTYDIGTAAPTLAPGEASRRITVTADDPARPPLLRGWLIMRGARYWRLTYLRIQATEVAHHREALTMAGGVGWEISHGEFYGASHTGSFANVAISNLTSDTSTSPKHWLFANNCVHDAGHGSLAGHTTSTDHNIYVNASGDSAGLITHNVLFNAVNGANLKIGNGGDARLPGASNVRVEYNTLVNAGRQVLVFGNLTGIRVWGNLMVHSIGANARVGTYLNTLSRTGAARVGNNYGYQLDRNLWAPNSPSRTYSDLGNNPLARGGAADPKLVGTGCGGLVPANPSVLRHYGRTVRVTN